MLSNKQTDKILVRNFIDGDYNSFEILFNGHKDRIFSFIMSKVKDRDLADDIFQDTFIKVINSLKQEKYNEEGKFLPWMMRIAYNLVIDHFRQKSKMRKVPQTSDFDIFQILDDGEMNQEEHMIRNESFSDLKILINVTIRDQLSKFLDTYSNILLEYNNQKVTMKDFQFQEAKKSPRKRELPQTLSEIKVIFYFFLCWKPFYSSYHQKIHTAPYPVQNMI